MNHQLHCTNKLRGELMLILIVALITSINFTAIPTSAATHTSPRNVTNNPSKVSYQQSKDLLLTVNKTKSLESPSKLSAIKSDDQKGLSISEKVKDKINLQQLSPTTSYDLVLKDESTQKFKQLRDDETSKHSYNTSSPPTAIIGHNSSADARGETMMTSDSRIISKSTISRSDDEYDTPTEDETTGGGDSISDSYDESSSNLSEQKVVKELTKIVSKGMAGATDQMKLDTLEGWKKRQKERKAVKDSRAKLFEDLLTAAINSHPEKSKKERKKRKKIPDNQRSITPVPLFHESDAANLASDPESARDAETVVKQLKGLVEDPSSYEDASSIEEDSSALSTNDEASPDESLNNSEGDSKPTTIKKSTPERPIIRQFKKIKSQISQRRKQLEQIKKIFNVDLSINPKDGSLVGKTPTTKKKEINSQEVGDFTIIDDSTSTPSHTKYKKRSENSSKSSKMSELMIYLRENPEILASVMAELTTDADPRLSSPSLLQSDSGVDDDLHQPSIYEPDTLGSKSSSVMGNAPKHQELERILWDKARRTTRQIELLNSDVGDQLSSGVIVPSNMKYPRVRPRIYNPLPESSRSHFNSTLPFRSLTDTSRSAEARLLESLRERQLLNLMKIDMVLAERQQAGSNRSQIFSMPNEPLLSSQMGDRLGEVRSNYQKSNQTNENLNRPIGQRQNPQRNNNNSGMSDEEIVHHFMVMNGGTNTPEFTLSGRNPNNWRLSEQFNNNPSQRSYNDVGSPYQDSTTGFKSSHYQPQQLSQPLNRFNNWRDVSRSEASSSQRSDKNIPTNLSWVPYDLTTGGSSSVQQHGLPSPLSEVNPLTRLYLRQPISIHNETEKIYTPTMSRGVPQVKDYADSIVIKPDHFLTPTHQTASDELMNPNTSMFMTRSSVTQKETGSSGSFAENDKELSHNSRGRISREDIEYRSRSDDDSSEPETLSRRRAIAPVDYFIAYKRQDHHLGDFTEGSPHPGSKRRRSVAEPSGSQYDGIGGMWAK